MPYPITLRCPTIYSSTPAPEASSLPCPSQNQLCGKWYISYTSSPAWKDKHNVLLTYTSLSPSLPSSSNIKQPSPGQPSNPTAGPLDDLITYYSSSSSSSSTAKQQSIHGTDTPSKSNPWAWTWRGNGWLKFVTSQWEIIGYGPDDTMTEGVPYTRSAEAVEEEMQQWMVVHAQKSLFTPEHLNVYTRRKGISGTLRKRIEEALVAIGVEALEGLAATMYTVS